METCERNCKLGREYLYGHAMIPSLSYATKKICLWCVFFVAPVRCQSSRFSSACCFGHDRFRSVSASHAAVSLLSDERKSKQNVAFNSNINMCSPPVVSHTLRSHNVACIHGPLVIYYTAECGWVTFWLEGKSVYTSAWLNFSYEALKTVEPSLNRERK